MVRDITKTINTLRCTAVGRCRERLEQATMKAKGILKNGQQEEKKETPPPCEEQYGVTSLMKRKHGL
jgi:hypothetical protein